MKQLDIKRFRVQLEHDSTKGELPPKEPAFASYFNFGCVCPKCKYRDEFFFQKKGAYTEADLLKLAQMSFNFANKKECGCHEQKEEPQSKDT